MHGNTNLLLSSAFSVESVEQFVVKFRVNVVENQAFLLLGCILGLKWIDIKLLPSSFAKCKFGKCTLMHPLLLAM